jgi:hypothetical protein
LRIARFILLIVDQQQRKKPEEVKKRPTQTAAGDYIDYEEVKE